MRKATILIIIASIIGVASTGVDAEELSTDPQRQELLQVYLEMKGDPVYLSLVSQLNAESAGNAEVENFLDYLPLSPRTILEFDMQVGRFEIMIPKTVVGLHERWVRKHPALARKHFGGNQLDRILSEADDPSSLDPDSLFKASVGTNRNVAVDAADDPDDYQGEIQVAVDPTNPQRLVAAANTFSSCGGTSTQSIFYSADGGENWEHTCAPTESAYGMACTVMFPTVFGSDPAVWWDSAGTVYLENMLICSTLGLLNINYSLVVSKSTDGGATWSGQGVVIDSWGSGTVEDKNFYAIDRWSGSPYSGRHYTCWDRANNEKFAWSADSGATWNEVDLPGIPGGTDLGCEIAVEDNGTVHVVFDTLTCSGSTCTNERMFFAKSADGGATWSTPVLVRDFDLVSFSGANTPGPQDSRGINPFGSVDVDSSGGACDGTLYAVFSDITTGTAENTDVFLTRSTDGGATWGTPVRMNDDGEGGNAQFHPFMAVDQSTGDVIAAWHDARNDVNNHAVDIYVARSTDCGQSFEANIQVSQASSEFNNSGISSTNLNTSDNSGANGNQAGEYLGLDVLNGTAYIAWTDTRHYFPSFTSEPQKENLGFAAVTFGNPDEIFSDGFESGGAGAWAP